MGKMKDRVGERRIMENGLEAEIVRYGSSTDIDIVFLIDGEKREHQKYGNFFNGKIGHPKKRKNSGKKNLDYLVKRKKDCEGVRIKQRCGIYLTCIRYNGRDDCDFISDDGKIKLTGKNWTEFKRANLGVKGSKSKPKTYGKYPEGSILKLSNGLYARVLSVKVEGRVAGSRVLQFQDGETTDAFLSCLDLYGATRHPKFVVSFKGALVSKNYLGFKDLKEAFRANDTVYFYYKKSENVTAIASFYDFIKMAGKSLAFTVDKESVIDLSYKKDSNTSPGGPGGCLCLY